MPLSPDTRSLDDLRFDAKRLHRGFIAHQPWAVERVRQHPPKRAEDMLRRADFLHVVAQENGFASWPALKLAAETQGLDRAAAVQRLKMALYHGQTGVVAALLERYPDLADGLFGLKCALYDAAAVKGALQRDPSQATTRRGPRSPMLHLCFSRWIKERPDLASDMLSVAQMLLSNGADVNDVQPVSDDHGLSALYGTVAADNVVLMRWLLENGANPNDGESLYHATELGHRDALRLLLEHGADPQGTNALLRALDFNDHEAVALLLSRGAKADDFAEAKVGGEAPFVIPALFQAARRGCDRRMVELLLDAGADPQREWKWATPYAYARAHGSAAVAEALEARGHATRLSAEEAMLAEAAEGRAGDWLDPARLPPAYAGIVHELASRQDRLAHVRALVQIGVPYDLPDPVEHVTPVQTAGWNGLPEMMGFLLSQRPDLSHVNRYGGTLLSTIIHGAENAPGRAQTDHIACLTLALTHGVALPRHALRASGREDVSAFLDDWARAHPGQIV